MAAFGEKAVIIHPVGSVAFTTGQSGVTGEVHGAPSFEQPGEKGEQLRISGVR